MIRPHRLRTPVPPVLALLLHLATSSARADVVQLQAIRDNTIYDLDDGLLSNGKGSFFFAGATSVGTVRRGLVAFDLSSMPAGATILSASVTLHMSRTIAAAQPVGLHRVLSDWGEGASDAALQEGGGAPAQAGDVTWQHNFFPSSFWATGGGDFVPAASATLLVGGIAFYTWGPTPELIADVQSWVDDPSSAFGWLVLGNEAQLTTAKRFDSRENLTAANRPVLTVEFTTAPPPSGEVPDGGAVPGAPLTASLVGGGQVQLDWGASCAATDDDYIVYEGALGGDFTSHQPVTCSTGGLLSFTFTPGLASAYFLVVPRSENGEGSHGRNDAGVERSAGASPCLPQALGACPAPAARPRS